MMMTKRSQNFLMMMTMLMKMLSGQHALTNLQKVAANKNMEDGVRFPSTFGLDCLLFYMVTGHSVAVVMPIIFEMGQVYLPLWVL